MASLFFRTPLDVDIHLDDEDSRQFVDVEVDKNRKTKVPIFEDGESVKGTLVVRPKDGKIVEHNGISITLIGSICIAGDRNNTYEFLSLVQELASPGDIRHNNTYQFEFKNVEKQHESYCSKNIKLRYVLKATVLRRLPDIIREKDLWVYKYWQPPESNSLIKMDVGIEDCLHIEFEYLKSKFHLKDVIIGKIYFLLVRLRIKHMEVNIIKREIIGPAPYNTVENETITRFELMDGSPNKGEVIPMRLFLSGYDLTPTYRDVSKKFSVRYFLSLILVDYDHRRYFKQSEIFLWRQKPSEKA